MIVKVQLSQPDRKTCLIYTEGRKYLWEGPTPPDVSKLMDKTNWLGEQKWKDFFKAKMYFTKHGGVRFKISKSVKWREW